MYHIKSGLPKWEETACQCGDMRLRFDPWVGKIPWRRAWQPTLISCLGNPIQRSLVGYSPGGLQSSETTEQLSTHAHNRQLQMPHTCLFLSGWESHENGIYQNSCVYRMKNCSRCHKL